MREILEDAVPIARKCTRCGMCKTGFLPAGTCPPGRRYGFASYYPQGRMDIAVALHEGDLPVTEGLAHIIDTCLQCKICDRQCYFVNGLRPLRVMKALAAYLEAYRRSAEPVVTPQQDALVEDLRDVVGVAWASNDAAVLVPYAPVRSPAGQALRPRCVVLPGSAQEVAEVVRVAARHGVAVMPRGNGTSLAGAVTDGVLVDCGRLSSITVDERNFSADIGAGVTGLDLQRAAHGHGLRALTAEPAACVCANVISTNLHSLFSHSYGVGADDVIDAEFVTYDGDLFRLADPAAAGLFVHRRDQVPERPPAVCTGMTVKLHPVPDDEGVVLVPFDDRGRAIEVARDLCARRIGSALGLISSTYVASFLSATEADAKSVERVLSQDLGIADVLILVGDRFAIDAVRAMCDPVLDQDTLRMLLLGLPNLRDDDGLRLLSELGDEAAPYVRLFGPDMLPVLAMALRPSVDAATALVDEDMRPFFRRLYRRQEMTDVRWLMTFRIVSARICRGRTFVPRIVWCPADACLIEVVVSSLARVGDDHGVPNGFGYMVPVDLGKRAVVEFDYYYDHSDDGETAAMGQVLSDSALVLRRLRDEYPELVGGGEIALQGLSRPETYLYRNVDRNVGGS